MSDRVEMRCRSKWATARLLADFGVIMLASAACATTGGGSLNGLPAAITAAGAVLGWYAGTRVAARLEGGSHPWLAGRLLPPSICVLTSACVVGALYAVLPAFADTATALGRFLAVAWPGTILVWLATCLKGLLAPVRDESLLIVGAGALGCHTAQQIRARSPRAAFKVVSLPGEQVDRRLPGPLLTTSEHLERVLCEHSFDEVYIAGNSLRHGKAMQAAVQACERFGMPFALPATHFRLDRSRPADPRLADGYVHYRSAEHKALQLVFKRALDVVASAVALLLLSPMLLLVALLIKVTSPGPILFRQQRMGRHGRRFDMLKFRSMVQDAEALQKSLMVQNEQAGPVFKITRDPRITRVGRFLRKYSIDELPQLINVLRGDMSIVGPRPPLPSEVARYEPWQRRRLSVRPGLTCIWQVSGRNQISFEEWMYLDMRYIDHWNLAQDIKLILKTVPVVVTGRGAS